MGIEEEMRRLEAAEQTPGMNGSRPDPVMERCQEFVRIMGRHAVAPQDMLFSLEIEDGQKNRKIFRFIDFVYLVPSQSYEIDDLAVTKLGVPHVVRSPLPRWTYKSKSYRGVEAAIREKKVSPGYLWRVDIDKTTRALIEKCLRSGKTMLLLNSHRQPSEYSHSEERFAEAARALITPK